MNCVWKGCKHWAGFKDVVVTFQRGESAFVLNLRLCPEHKRSVTGA